MLSFLHTLLTSPLAQVLALFTAVCAALGACFSIWEKRGNALKARADEMQAVATTDRIHVETTGAKLDVQIRQTDLIEKLQEGLTRTSERLLDIQTQVDELSRLKPRVEELEAMLRAERQARDAMQVDRDKLADLLAHAQEQIGAAQAQIGALSETIEDLHRQLRSRDAEIARQNEHIFELETQIAILQGTASGD